MAGRHRVAAANRPLGREVGRVGALLLLTTAPLVQVGPASAESAWSASPERRGQSDEPGRGSGDRDGRDRDGRDRDGRDRRSADGRDDDGPAGARKVSNRQRDTARDDDDDDFEERAYRGRHRAAESDEDSDRANRRGSRESRDRSVSGRDDDRRSRVRATVNPDDRSPAGRSRARSVEVSEGSGTTRKARSEAASVSGGASQAKWDRLAQCESNQRWSSNTGNGYRGGLQFSDSTWRAYGGGRYAPAAHQASREEQIAVAEKVRREQGWSAWPGCSRKLGYA